MYLSDEEGVPGGVAHFGGEVRRENGDLCYWLTEFEIG